MPADEPQGAIAGRAKSTAALIVALACLINLWAYHCEVTTPAPDVNDHILHFGLISEANRAWKDGGSAHDTWVPYWAQGFPVLRYYQHLPHVVVVLLHQLLAESVPLYNLFKAVNLLLLVLLPLSFYSGARLLGMDPIGSGLVALCTPLLGADPSQHYFLGIQARTFTWMGGGLYPQLVATALFPPAVGMTWQTIREGRRYGPTLLLLTATWLSHLLLAYSACLLGLLLLLRPEGQGRRWRMLARLAVLYAGTAAVTSYLLLPSLLETQFLSKSMWESKVYWDSFGATTVLRALATGGLFDGPRLPVFTLLVGAGLVGGVVTVWLRRSGSGPAQFAVLAFFLSLALFFGRPAWGPLLKMLPFSANMPLHRFICAVQYAGILLAGIGLNLIWRIFRWHASPGRMWCAIAATLILLSPAIVSVYESAGNLRLLRTASGRDFNRNAGGLIDQMRQFEALNAARPGRGYSGESWDWGKQYVMSYAPVYAFWWRFGIPTISSSYHSLSLNHDLEASFDPNRPDHCNLFNVRYFLANEASQLPRFADVVAVRPGIHAAVAETEGYFSLVRTAWFFPAPRFGQEDLKRLNQRFIKGPWHAKGVFVRIGWDEGDGPRDGEAEITPHGIQSPDPNNPLSPPTGRIVRSWGSGDRYGATVIAEEAGYLLFRMTYHPGWRATLNGREVQTVMLSPGYVGVPVDLGHYRVSLHYQPGAMTTVFLWLGTALLILAFAWDFFRRRQSQSETPVQSIQPPKPAVPLLLTRLLSKMTPLREDFHWWVLAALIFLMTRLWLVFVFDPKWTDTTLYFNHYVQFTRLGENWRSYFSLHTFEYPPIMLPLMLIPGWIASLFGAATRESYGTAFRCLMFFVDTGIFCSLPFILRRSIPELSSRGLILRWSAYIPVLLMIPYLAYDRLDIILAFVMMLSLSLEASGRHRSSLFFVGLSAAMKIFPALVAAPLLFRRLASARATGVRNYPDSIFFCLLGFGAGLLPLLAFFGVEAMSFVNFQGSRGLQIESIPASFGLIAHLFGGAAHTAWEAKALALVFADAGRLQMVWQIAGLVIIGGLAVICFAKRDALAGSRAGFGRTLGWAALLLSAGVVFSPVFSPQFLIWLAPIFLVLPLDDRLFWRMAALLAVLLLLTQAVWPFSYSELQQLAPFPVILIILRNGLFVLLIGLLVYWKMEIKDETPAAADLPQPSPKKRLASRRRISQEALISLFYFFLALVNLRVKLLLTPAWFDGTLARNHGLLLNLSYTNNEQSRLLQFIIPEILHRFFSVGIPDAYILQRWGFTFLAFVLFHRYLRKWFDAGLSFAGVVSLAAVMPLTYFNHLQESSPLLLVTFLLALQAIRDRRPMLLFFSLMVGGLNNETLLIVPLVYLLYHFESWQPRKLAALALRTLGVSLPLLVTVIPIRVFTRDRPHLGGAWHLPDNIRGIFDGFHTPFVDLYAAIYLYIFFIFNVLWVYAFVRLRGKPKFLRRASLMIPFFIIAHLLTGIIHEVRQMLPLSVIIIPMALWFLFPEAPEKGLYPGGKNS